jgi:hypothetical protein
MIRITPSSLLSGQLPISSREPLLHDLKLGQILQARVLSENHGGQVKLLVGDSKLVAHTSLQVTRGQNLTLQVNKTGPLPELRLLSLSDSQQLQTQALKRMLPRQRPLSELFERLHQLQSSSNPPDGRIKQAMQELVERLISVEHPRFRQSLKTALSDSGLLTEHQLVNQEPRGNDLKLNLLRLYDLVKTVLSQPGPTQDSRLAQSPEQDLASLQSQSVIKQLTDLIKQLDGAIARIQTHQLASLPQNDQTPQVWQFELPLLHKDRVDLHQITIKQEEDGSRTDQSRIWSLTLQMNLQPLGPMRVQLRLQDKSLSTLIWVERQDTMKLLEHHLPELQQAFEQAHLEVKRLQAYQSRIEADEPIPQTAGLVSEKA